MTFFKKISDELLTDEGISSLTILCGSAALLIAVAVFISRGNAVFLSHAETLSQAAAVAGSPNSSVLAPFVSIRSISGQIANGAVAKLEWVAIRGKLYDACYLGGGQWGSGVPVDTSGSISTQPLTEVTQYWYQCHDIYNGWQGPMYIIVPVKPASAI